MRIPFFGKKDPVTSRMEAVAGKAVLDPVGPDFDGWSMLSGRWPFQWKDGSELFRPLTVIEKEASYRHPIIKGCCDEIAQGIAKANIEIGTWIDEDEWKAAKNHPMMDVLRNPWPQYTTRRLISVWIVRYLLTGTSYIQKIYTKGDRRKIANLAPLPTSWVHPSFAQFNGMIEGYRVNGQKELVPPEDMIILNSLDPMNMWGGISALDAAMNDLYLDREREQYMAELLENLKAPGMIFTAKNGMSARRKKEFKEDLHNQVGKGRRGEPMILNGEVDVDMPNPLGDMDWPGQMMACEARMCTSFQVPPILIGARVGLEHGTYNNYKETRSSFYKETLANLWPMVDEALSQGLFGTHAGEEGVVTRHRSDLLPEMQEDKSEKSDRIMNEFEGGLLPKETARKELNYDTDELETLDKKEQQERLKNDNERQSADTEGQNQDASPRNTVRWQQRRSGGSAR